MLSKIWAWDTGIRDPRSGKNLFRIQDPGVKKTPDPGSGSATLPATRGDEIIAVLALLGRGAKD
jgi:hypothetical protein